MGLEETSGRGNLPSRGLRRGQAVERLKKKKKKMVKHFHHVMLKVLAQKKNQTFAVLNADFRK